jgi:hypothetical protein
VIPFSRKGLRISNDGHLPAAWCDDKPFGIHGKTDRVIDKGYAIRNNRALKIRIQADLYGYSGSRRKSGSLISNVSYLRKSPEFFFQHGKAVRIGIFALSLTSMEEGSGLYPGIPRNLRPVLSKSSAAFSRVMYVVSFTCFLSQGSSAG